MRFTVQATRTFTETEWTRVEQVPTFWVEALNTENAEQIACSILGVAMSQTKVNITAVEADD